MYTTGFLSHLINEKNCQYWAQWMQRGTPRWLIRHISERTAIKSAMFYRFPHVPLSKHGHVTIMIGNFRRLNVLGPRQKDKTGHVP